MGKMRTNTRRYIYDNKQSRCLKKTLKTLIGIKRGFLKPETQELPIGLEYKLSEAEQGISKILDAEKTKNDWIKKARADLEEELAKKKAASKSIIDTCKSKS